MARKAMPEPSTLYASVFLTPFRAAVLNLFLIGIPFRYGLLPTGCLLQDWFQQAMKSVMKIDEALGLESPDTIQPCSMFAPTQTRPMTSEEFDLTYELSQDTTTTILLPSTLCTNNVETRAVYDMGLSFLHHYFLIWVILLCVWVRPQKHSAYTLLDFHRVMLGCILVSLLLLAFFQKSHPPVMHSPRVEKWIRILPSELWNHHFFASFVFYNLLALSLSLWTLLTRTQHAERESGLDRRRRNRTLSQERLFASKNGGESTTNNGRPMRQPTAKKNSDDDEFMKWSIPANAIFCGAVMELFAATAQGQALWENRVLDYYQIAPENDDDYMTPRIRLAFGVRAFYIAICGVWLLRVRCFLSMPQMRYICAYQVLWRSVDIVRMYHLQTEMRHVNVDSDMDDTSFLAWTTLGWIVQTGLFVVYFLGFLWAGQAEGFSTVLSSEYEDDFSTLRKPNRRRMVGVKTG